MKSTLIIGGARSGKSRFAQETAAKTGKAVLFVATAEAGDEEMRQRIEAHRKARPSAWKTLEVTTHVGSQISQNMGNTQTVILDCITMLINNVFQQHTRDDNKDLDAVHIEKEVDEEIGELIKCMERSDADFIIVSNEVGLGLVPADPMSRLFRDLLGKANQMLAQHIDEVILMVAGIPVKVKPPP
jgi:adenosylcobinamide kinase/adenosylcobinamide-phosphate guanylyltransferase